MDEDKPSPQKPFTNVWTEVVESMPIAVKSILTTVGVDFNGSRLRLICGSTLFIEIIEGRLPLIEFELEKRLGKLPKIKLDHEPGRIPDKQIYEALPERKTFPATTAVKPLNAYAHRSIPNPNLTFDTYIAGDSNGEARRLARLLVPGVKHKSFLFIVGGTGVGKTHLLQAIMHEAVERERASNVAMVRSTDFLEDFTQSARSDQDTVRIGFKKYYGGIKVLLIDDMHLFRSSQKMTLQELRLIFERLEQGGMVVITSLIRPRDLLLGPELHSRLSTMVCTEIGPPEFALRLAIFRNEMERSGHPISEELGKMVVERLGSHLRYIKGAAANLIARLDLFHHEVTAELICTLFGKEPITPGLNADLIIDTVADFHGIDHELLKRGGRDHLAKSRQFAMYLCREMLQMSTDEIATLFCTNASYVDSMMETFIISTKEYPHIRQDLITLRERIKNRLPKT